MQFCNLYTWYFVKKKKKTFLKHLFILYSSVPSSQSSSHAGHSRLCVSFFAHQKAERRPVRAARPQTAQGWRRRGHGGRSRRSREGHHRLERPRHFPLTSQTLLSWDLTHHKIPRYLLLSLRCQTGKWEANWRGVEWFNDGTDTCMICEVESRRDEVVRRTTWSGQQSEWQETF